MKFPTRSALLMLAALPVAAQASVASEQALKINPQPEASASAESIAASDVADFRYAGGSAAAEAARLQLVASDQRATDFSADDADEGQARLGHAADW